MSTILSEEFEVNREGTEIGIGTISDVVAEDKIIAYNSDFRYNLANKYRDVNLYETSAALSDSL